MTDSRTPDESAPGHIAGCECGVCEHWRETNRPSNVVNIGLPGPDFGGPTKGEFPSNPKDIPLRRTVLDGIKGRHAAVDASQDPVATAKDMAYLSHLDRRDLLDEHERLTAVLESIKPWLVWGPDSPGPQWKLNELLRQLSGAPSSAVETTEDDPHPANLLIRPGARYMLNGYCDKCQREWVVTCQTGTEVTVKAFHCPCGHVTQMDGCAEKASARTLTLLDFGYAPGDYTFICHDCEREATGDKRCLRCEACAQKKLNAQNGPAEQGKPAGNEDHA